MNDEKMQFFKVGLNYIDFEGFKMTVIIAYFINFKNDDEIFIIK